MLLKTHQRAFLYLARTLCDSNINYYCVTRIFNYSAHVSPHLIRPIRDHISRLDCEADLTIVTLLSVIMLALGPW